MKQNLVVGAVALSLMLLGGCAGSSLRGPAPGEQEIVKTSVSSKPDWARDLAKPDDEKHMYFVGRAMGVSDPDLGGEEAQAAAEKLVATSVGSSVTGYFTSKKLGSNAMGDTSGKSVASVVQTAVDHVKIHGLRVAQRYEQEIKANMNGRIVHGYNVFVLTEIQKDDYDACRQQITEAVAAEAHIKLDSAARQLPLTPN